MASKKPTGRGPGRPRKNTPGTKLEVLSGGATPPPPTPPALPPAPPGGGAPLSQLPPDTLPEITPYGEPAGQECAQCATAIRKLQQRGQSTAEQDSWLELYEELHPNLVKPRTPIPPQAAAQANAQAAPVNVTVGAGLPGGYQPPMLPATIMPRTTPTVGEITAQGQQTTGIMGKYAELCDRMVRMSEEQRSIVDKVFEHMVKRDIKKEEDDRARSEMLTEMAMKGLKAQFKAAKMMAKAMKKQGMAERDRYLVEAEVSERVEAAAAEIADGLAVESPDAQANEQHFTNTMKRAAAMLIPALPLLAAKIAPFLGLPAEMVGTAVQGLMAQVQGQPGQAPPSLPAQPVAEPPSTPENSQ